MIPGWKNWKKKGGKISNSKEKYSRPSASSRKERDEGIRGSRVAWVEDLRWGSRLIFVATSGDLGDSRRKKERRILFSFIVGCSSSRRIIEGASYYSVILLIVLGGMPRIPIPSRVVHPPSSSPLASLLYPPSPPLGLSWKTENSFRDRISFREKKKRKTVSPKKLWKKSSFFFGRDGIFLQELQEETGAEM